jgi:hypothetical protein
VAVRGDKEKSFTGELAISPGKLEIKAEGAAAGAECNTEGISVTVKLNLKMLAEYVATVPKGATLTFGLQNSGAALKIVPRDTRDAVYYQMPQE